MSHSISSTSSSEIEDLKAQIAALKAKLRAIQPQKGGAPAKRKNIQEMSSEVVDSNPYSRLMALKRMGIVANYEKIRDFTVMIVGLGGIGRYVGPDRSTLGR